jgi:DNA polymerase III subunit gamma/tau
VKFLFATTEVNKVPVTVLSRCQRFDLRRIDRPKSWSPFRRGRAAEGVEVEPDALAMIARAAEGSARDGLSILDQAIAHGAGNVTAEQVRDMLGLADRGRIRDLLELSSKATRQSAAGDGRGACDLGIDPAALIRGLMEALHSAPAPRPGRDRPFFHPSSANSPTASPEACPGRRSTGCGRCFSRAFPTSPSRPTRRKRRPWRCFG